MLRTDPASGNLLFNHRLARRQTLYGAARFYGLALEDVYKLNPSLRKGYEPGSSVTVVIPTTTIKPTFGRDSVGWYVPIHYRMAAGETVYGLTRRTLGWSSDSLLRVLNPELNPAHLSPNQVLKIGYLRIDGIDPGSQPAIADPYVLRNYGLRQRWATSTEGKRLRSLNGKAAWTSSGDKNKFMVLHRTAPLGSVLEIEDPPQPEDDLRNRRRKDTRTGVRQPGDLGGEPAISKGFWGARPRVLRADPAFVTPTTGSARQTETGSVR